MTRRRALRGTVLLSTALFLSVLGIIVYIALQKSRVPDNMDRDDTKTVQERLEFAANRAAKAAASVLNTRGDIATAAETALAVYAEASGVTWRPRSYGQGRVESTPYQIRCKIGADVVTLNIHAKTIQLKAESGSQETMKNVSVVLRIADGEKE